MKYTAEEDTGLLVRVCSKSAIFLPQSEWWTSAYKSSRLSREAVERVLVAHEREALELTAPEANVLRSLLGHDACSAVRF